MSADMPAAPSAGPQRLVILDQSIKVLYQSILVLSLYFLFAGHNLPGGGFVGGLTAGAAVSLRYVSGGAAAVRTTFRVPSHVILGLGLGVAAGTAFLPIALGGAVLEHGEYETNLPVFGDVKFVSALAFDVGVYLVVVGLVLMAFAAFGDDLGQLAQSDEPGDGAGADQPDAGRDDRSSPA